MSKRVNFVLTALVASVLSLTACDKKTETSTTTPTQETTQEKTSTLPENAQTFTVGIDASYPPYDFRDELGNAIGFDADIIRAIGEKQGFAVNIMAKDWEGLVADFDKGVYDISISGYSRTSEREQKYLVSNAYSFAQDIVVTKKGGAVTSPIKQAEQLKSFRVAVQGSSPYEDQLKGLGVTTIVAKPSSFLALTAVARDEADAMVVDKGVARYYAQQLASSGTAVEFEFHEPTGDGFDAYELVILTPKDKTELMDKINQGIVDIIKDGTYANIYKKWFGVEPDPRYIPKV